MPDAGNFWSDRSRILADLTPSGNRKNFVSDTTWIPTPGVRIYDQQFTRSRNNLAARRAGAFYYGRSGRDTGSGFVTVRHGHTRYDSWQAKTPLYEGLIGAPRLDVPPGPTTAFKTPVFDSLLSPQEAIANPPGLSAFGTKAIARVNPDTPRVQLPSIIMELAMGGIPRLIGASLKEAVGSLRSKAGSEYLNVQFGWFPLVADIIDLVQTAMNAQDLIDQYLRDANRPVRRRFSETPSVATYSLSDDGGVGVNPTNAPFGTVCKTEESYTVSKWFTGRFVYYVPMSDALASRIERYRILAGYLFGLKATGMTPEQVWEVAPWSWLVDWFSDIGDIVSNVTNLGIDSTVLEYGYAMQHERTYRTQTGYLGYVGVHPQPSGFPSRYYYTEFVSERKYRLRADPYGFGMDWSALSLKQLSILAALGLSKS